MSITDEEKRDLEDRLIQQEKDAGDHRLLSDMKRDDIDALKALLARKQYEPWFPTAEKALEFMGIALFSFLDKRLKISVTERMNDKFLTKLLKKRGVQVENRPYEEEEDQSLERYLNN